MAVCYDTNGNEDTTQFPCSADGSPAQCCEIGQLCASDGLCVNNGTGGLTKYTIHGCSVQDWTDGQVDTCPHQCIETGGVGVTDCGVGTFCCYGFGGCDCNNSTQTFNLDPIRIVATISGETSTSTPTPTSSSTTSSSPTADANASSSSSSSSSSNALPIGLGVGLGVGIPLLIAAIVAVFFCLRKRRSTPVPEKDIGMAGYQAPPGYQAPSAQNGGEAGWYQQGVASPPVPMEGTKPISGPGTGGYFGAQQQGQGVPHELPSRQEPQELPGRQEPHELQ